MPQLVLDGTKPPTFLLRQVLVALGLPAPPPPARPASAAAAWFDGSLKKMHEALADVEPGTSVGVVTLLGSLCPVTRGHTRAFIEARRILLGEVARPARLEPFGAVIGCVKIKFYGAFVLNRGTDTLVDFHTGRGRATRRCARPSRGRRCSRRATAA